MALHAWLEVSEAQPGAPGLRALTVSHEQWRQVAQDVAAAGGRLVTLWSSDDERSGTRIHAAFVADPGGLVLRLPIADPDTPYPAIEDLFPAAARMQRAIADLSGVRSAALDTRPWLRHAAWPLGYRPLTDSWPVGAAGELVIDAYSFVRVEGDGVHEIAVGPVHAGIIEPGHFRFSVVGEKVLRLEEHLGYVHKGIERRFADFAPLEGHRLAGRISGDSTAAYGWAYCMALESALRGDISPRATWLRALLLERERVANHLGDLGALGNDAAFSFGLAQFSRLREDWLRASMEIAGHRFMMDYV